jgi:integrase
MRKRLNEAEVARQLARKVKTDETIWDTHVKGFGLRLRPSDRGLGSANYVAGGTFGRKSWTQRPAANARLVPYKDGLNAVLELLRLNEQKRNPDDVKAERERAEAVLEAERQRLAGHTFNKVADAYEAEVVAHMRQGAEAKRYLAVGRKAWGDRPIHEIRPAECAALIRQRKQSSPSSAQNLFSNLRRLFEWAVNQFCFGIESNPMGDLSPAMLIGERVSRDRVLSIEEARRVWDATSALGPPGREAFQVILLSGLRLREVTEARWGEIDLENKIWVIPAARMKGKNGKARPFAVPLTPRMISIFNSMPRHSSGLVFSANGRTPICVGQRHFKRRLDAACGFSDWVTHDIRRTVASNLVDLGVAEDVADALLSHKRKGVKGVYIRTDRFDDRRRALEKWDAALVPDTATVPADDNVVPFPLAS